MTSGEALFGAGWAGDSAAGVTETETRSAIAEIEGGVPLTGALRSVKQLAIALSVSIDKGNVKGRAIANEASQLFAMMQHLAPPDEVETDQSALSPELRRLFDVFAAPAQFAAAPAESDAATTGDAA